jgi:hypothetical protein
MDEPLLRVWMQDRVEPATHYAERPGRWVTAPAWPPPDVERRELALPGELPRAHRSIESTGANAGAWCPDGGEGDWPGEQREEDERSLAFDLDPLDQRLELLGFPEVVLELSVDRPKALVAVRLCDVAPDGSSLLVTRGLRNLTHTDDHAEASDLEPGRRYTFRVRLDAIAQAVPAGHRLRVAVSTAYWPWAWPSPEPVTLTVHGGRLLLPVRPLREDEPEPPPFGEPEWAKPIEVEVLEPGETHRRLRHDPETGAHEVEFEWDVGGRRRLPAFGTEMLDTNVTRYRIVDGDPLSASVQVSCITGLGRAEWQTRVETDSRMRSTATEFHVTQRLEAFEGEERVYERTWELRLPRDGV